MKRVLYLSALVGLTALLVAFLAMCDDDDDDDNDDNNDDDDDDSADDDDNDDNDDAPPEWVWVPIAGAKCRDGSATGVAVRHQPESDKLMIELQGGGACFDPDSCEDNPDHFGEADFTAWAAGSGTAGIFNMAREENPVRDWNVVFVPYCTGDLFAGSKTNGAVPGVTGQQQFVGYQNAKKVISWLQGEFPAVTKILLAGDSAGGFGVMLNYAHLAEAFPAAPVTLLDDSGPLFEADDVLSPCLQKLVVLLWNANPAIEDGCADCVKFTGDGFSGWHPYLAETYPNGTFGLFSSMEDAEIRDFFGMGQNHCTGTEPIPADAYRAGLLSMRDGLLVPTGKWSTYYIEGDTHTAIADDPTFYDTSVGGTALTAWLGELLDGVPTAVGP